MFRHIPQPTTPFAQAFCHQTQMALLQVAEAPMQQLGTDTAGLLQALSSLKELHLPAPLRQSRGNAEAIDASTYNANATESQGNG
jgi:hypothetical protein